MPKGVNKDYYNSTYLSRDNFLKEVLVHIYGLHIDDFGNAEESVPRMFMPFISSRKWDENMGYQECLSMTDTLGLHCPIHEPLAHVVN